MSENDENRDYGWVPVYEAIANTLQEHRDNPELIKSIFDEIRGNQYFESWIDPFSFYAALNKVSVDNRKKKIVKVLEGFDIDMEAPERYDGVPKIIARNAWYTDGDEESNIILWNLFSASLQLADLDNAEDSKEFIKLYDKALCIGNVGTSKLTQGLFSFRPRYYLPLNGCVTSWLKVHNIDVPQEIKGDEYLKILHDTRGLGVDFPELSDKAYLERNQQNDDLSPEQDGECVGRRYWQLVANPGICSLSDMENGSEQTYTLWNKNGNPRRIQKHMLDARPGDLAIGCEATPSKKAVCICEISREHDDERIWFKKLHNLVEPVTFDEMKNDSVLKNDEFMKNQNGSFFQLTQEEYERIIALSDGDGMRHSEPIAPYTREDFLRDVYVDTADLDDMVGLLHAKGNLILQGSPGTGKTYAAKRLAWLMANGKDDSRIGFVQFHQNTSYDDFIYGYRPTDDGGFAPKAGVFADFCAKAAADSGRPYVFIIDEINRANVSKVFGEALMCIEKDHRDENVILPVAGKKFQVPANVYIIGMMNTADRSLALIDYALRRRFAFFSMRPRLDDLRFLNDNAITSDSFMKRLVDQVGKLNERICEDPALGPGFTIGHSYFHHDSGEDDATAARRIVRYELKPLLREYWFDDLDTEREWAGKLEDAVR